MVQSTSEKNELSYLIKRFSKTKIGKSKLFLPAVSIDSSSQNPLLVYITYICSAISLNNTVILLNVFSILFINKYFRFVEKQQDKVLFNYVPNYLVTFLRLLYMYYVEKQKLLRYFL